MEFGVKCDGFGCDLGKLIPRVLVELVFLVINAHDANKIRVSRMKNIAKRLYVRF